MKTMKCQGCYKEIVQKTPNQKWCLRCGSDQRKEQKTLSKKECPLCQKEFIPHNGQQKYCSQNCIKKSNNTRSNSRWANSKKKKPKLFFGSKEILVI
jgi:hypothetical protein